jgi:diadenylate cyclase
MRIADLFDILIISVLLYFIILWLKNRASRSLVVGIGIIALCYVCAQRFGMYLTSSLFQVGFTAMLLALVLVFQADIRRLIERLASWNVSSAKRQSLASSFTTDTLVETVGKLAQDSVGALIVIKGREPIDRHIRGGVSLGGRISFPLLYGIFNTQSPTHDGAVVIEGERIDRFAVYLPLSQNVKEGTEAGTRHAAGRGLSEVCDAMVIIVSEERGTISIAEHGTMEVVRSTALLKERLDRFYQSMKPDKNAPFRIAWLKHNALLKLVSLVLAVGLWFFFAHRVETINRTFTVPVEWRNLPANYFVDSIRPVETKVSLSGSERDFNFDASAMVVSLDLGTVREGPQDFMISEWSLMNKPVKVSVNRIEPQTIKLKVYAMTAMDVMVKVKTQNNLPDGLKLLSLTAEPAKVKIMVPRNKKADYGPIWTEPLNLDEISQSATKWLKLVIPEKARVQESEIPLVKVKIDVTSAAETRKRTRN